MAARRSTYRPGSGYGNYSNNIGIGRTSKASGSGYASGALYPASVWDCYPSGKASGYTSDYKSTGGSYATDFKGSGGGGYISDYGKESKGGGGYTSDYGAHDYGRSYLSRTGGFAEGPSTYTSSPYVKSNVSSYTSPYRRAPATMPYGGTSRTTNDSTPASRRSYSRSVSREDAPRVRNSYSRSISKEDESGTSRRNSSSSSKRATSIEEERGENGAESPSLPSPSPVTQVPLCHSESRGKRGGKAPADFTSDSDSESESEEESSSDENDFLICRSTSPSQENNLNIDDNSPSLTYKILRKKKVFNVDLKDEVCQTDEASCLPIENADRTITSAFSPHVHSNYTSLPQMSSSSKLIDDELGYSPASLSSSPKLEPSPKLVKKLKIENDSKTGFSRDTSPNEMVAENKKKKTNECINKDFRKSVLNMNLKSEEMEEYLKLKNNDRLKEENLNMLHAKYSPYTSSSDNSSSEYENVPLSAFKSRSSIKRTNSKSKVSEALLRKSNSRHRLEVHRTRSRNNLSRNNSRSKLSLTRSSSRSNLEPSKSEAKLECDLKRSHSLGKADLLKSDSNPKLSLSRNNSKEKIDLRRDTSKLKSSGIFKSNSKSKLPLRGPTKINGQPNDKSSHKALNGFSTKSSSEKNTCTSTNESASGEEIHRNTVSANHKTNSSRENVSDNCARKSSSTSLKSNVLPPRPNKKDDDAVTRSPKALRNPNKRIIKRTESRTKILESQTSASKSSSSEHVSLKIPKIHSKGYKSPSPPFSVVTLKPPIPKSRKSPEIQEKETNISVLPSKEKKIKSSGTDSNSHEEDDQRISQNNGLNKNCWQSSSGSEVSSNCKSVCAEISFNLESSKVKKSPTVVHVGSSNEENSPHENATSMSEDESEMESSSCNQLKYDPVQHFLNLTNKSQTKPDVIYQKKCTLSPIIYRRNLSLETCSDQSESSRRESSSSEQISKTLLERRDSIQSNFSESSLQTTTSNEESVISSASDFRKTPTNKKMSPKLANKASKRKDSLSSNASIDSTNKKGICSKNKMSPGKISAQSDKMNNSTIRNVNSLEAIPISENNKYALQRKSSLGNNSHAATKLIRRSSLSESASNSSLKTNSSAHNLGDNLRSKSNSLSEDLEKGIFNQRRNSSSTCTVNSREILNKIKESKVKFKKTNLSAKNETSSEKSGTSRKSEERHCKKETNENSRKSSIQSTTTEISETSEDLNKTMEIDSKTFAIDNSENTRKQSIQSTTNETSETSEISCNVTKHDANDSERSSLSLEMQTTNITKNNNESDIPDVLRKQSFQSTSLDFSESGETTEKKNQDPLEKRKTSLESSTSETSETSETSHKSASDREYEGETLKRSSKSPSFQNNSECFKDQSAQSIPSETSGESEASSNDNQDKIKRCLKTHLLQSPVDESNKNEHQAMKTLSKDTEPELVKTESFATQGKESKHSSSSTSSTKESETEESSSESEKEQKKESLGKGEKHDSYHTVKQAANSNDFGEVKSPKNEILQRTGSAQTAEKLPNVSLSQGLKHIETEELPVKETKPILSLAQPKEPTAIKNQTQDSYLERKKCDPKFIGNMQDIDSFLKEGSEDEAETFEEFESKFKEKLEQEKFKEDQMAARKRLSLFISKVQDIDDMLGSVSPLSPNATFAEKLQGGDGDIEEVDASAVKVHESKAQRPKLESYTEEIDPSAVLVRESRAQNTQIQQVAEEIDSGSVRYREAKHLMQGHISKVPKQKLEGDCILQIYRAGDVDFGLYFDAENLDQRKKEELVSRTNASTKVRVIVEKLKLSTGRDMRRVLFGLKNLFQADKDLVKAFLQKDGLTYLTNIGSNDQNGYQSYVLRVLGQLMLYVDGMNAIAKHSPTLRWLYGLLSSPLPLPALKLLALFVDFAPPSHGPLMTALIAEADREKGLKPWHGVMQILKSEREPPDMELLSQTVMLINKVLEGVPDLTTYYDIVDFLEEQDMASVSQRFLASPAASTDLIHQLQLYEAVLQAEDGSDCKKFSPIPFNIKLKSFGQKSCSGKERRRSWRAGAVSTLSPQPKPPSPSGLKTAKSQAGLNLWLKKKEENKKETPLPPKEVSPPSNVGITPALRRHREREALKVKNEEPSPPLLKSPSQECADTQPPPQVIPAGPSLVEKHRSKFEAKPEPPKETAVLSADQRSSLEGASQEKKRLIIKKPKKFDLEKNLPPPVQIQQKTDKKTATLTEKHRSTPEERLPIQVPACQAQDYDNQEDVEPEKTFKEKQMMFQAEADRYKQHQQQQQSPVESKPTTVLSKQPSFVKQSPSRPTESSAAQRPVTLPQPLIKEPSRTELVPRSPRLRRTDSSSSKKGWMASRTFGKSQEEEKQSQGLPLQPSPTQDTPQTRLRKETSPKMILKRDSSSKDIFNKQSPVRSPSSGRMGDTSGLVTRAKEGLSSVSAVRSESRTNLILKQPSSSSLAEFKHEIQWENLLHNLKRPLLINDLDFQDLAEDDDVDIFRPLQGMENGGPMPPPPPPPIPATNLAPPPPPPGPPPPPARTSIPPPPPQFMAAKPAPALPSWVRRPQQTSRAAPSPPPPPPAKNKKTVKLFWKEIKEDATMLTKAGKKRTIWDELKPIEVDVTSLENLFESKAKDLANKEKAGQEGGKKNELIVLDAKRSNAINIGLTKLPPPRTIKAAILKMDSTIMNKEGIEKILTTMLPSEEEKTKIAEAQLANPDVPLGQAEQFLLTLASISNLEARLKLWAFRLDFDTAEKEVAEQLMDLKQAIEEIESNETFRVILATLRTIGNFLNGAEAKGFQLDYLSKVPEVKDTVHKHTLLYHLCTIVMEKYPGSTDLYSQMGAVTRTSKVDYDEVKRSLAKMESDCKASWEYHKLIARHDGSSYMKSRMAEFLEDCSERIIILSIVHRRVINRWYKLLVYLGVPAHAIRDTKIQAVCKGVSEFALEYRTTRDRLLHQASQRERTRTRGKRITDTERFKAAASMMEPAHKADQQLRQILSSDDSKGTSPSWGNTSRTRSRFLPPTQRVGGRQQPEEGGMTTDADDEILESLVKTATAQTRSGDQPRERKKARYGDRKSLRRTRSGLDCLLLE